jgi:hypothetical protein
MISFILIMSACFFMCGLTYITLSIRFDELQSTFILMDDYLRGELRRVSSERVLPHICGKHATKVKEGILDSQNCAFCAEEAFIKWNKKYSKKK